MPKKHPESPSSFEFIVTPDASQSAPKENYGVRTTTSPAIKNAPLPADGAGNDSWNNAMLLFLLVSIPWFISFHLGGGLFFTVFIGICTAIPILMAFWTACSFMSPRMNEKATLPGRPVEHYLNFRTQSDRAKYQGKRKIPIEVFYEKYFRGEVTFNSGDCLENLEYRHDWASFRFTWGVFRHFLFGFVPELVVHSRSQDEEQVSGTYDRGDDFYAWFLGPRMVYTSGLIGDVTREESLEQLQDNKLTVVCEKIGLQPGDTMLDIGCGWGTLATFASVHYKALVTGVTLGRNQTEWGNTTLESAGIPQTQSRILRMDYRDSPRVPGGYKKITSLEMSEHVGVRHFRGFLQQVYDMLDDDGVFYLQYSGLRKYWQYEDLIWGLFMNKYAPMPVPPLGWVIDKLEGTGFEVRGIDTVGVHYSATLWRWYRNWLANRQNVEAKYGAKWYRIWEIFLAWSTIVSRQGGATCYQIILVKNLNSTHRVEGVPSQFGITEALRSAVEKIGGIPSAFLS
ncbi:S-adenosyl-L-methionine-dependent methyltransferase [Penicillium maclennaniae]|uniref:S-adenosyl-L-methionine-dependent methyltransferase n=1 Tax=Penicillium maclennaniae TaxID=1343394 RepID=UPI0025423B3C|nr:S-adenosyl-L-methionine-dependent methyltransferase [Penicillium maclennaniae]KAJ5678076.1 S-adenosyl-L-methionine-dependent methyltransferase [Penicillium maclennaniae]